MILLGVLGLITAARVIQASGKQQLSRSVCTSVLCRQVAREIISSMDETVNPCEDFYAYACNRWNSSSGLSHTVLDPKIFKQLQELFESGNYTNPTEKKAVDIYNQCINETRDRPFDVHGLVRAVDDLFGGWSLLKGNPNVSAVRLDEIFLRLQQNNIQSIIHLSVEKNDFSSEQNILFLRMPQRMSDRWGYCARYPSPCNATEHLMNTWTLIISRLLKVANASVHWPTVEKRLEKVLMLDFMMATDPKGSVNFLKRLTFGDLSKPPYRSRFFSSLMPLFNAMLKTSLVKFQATTATEVGDMFPQYLLKLDQTMAQLEADGDAGLATIADWLWWTTLYHYYLVFQEAGNCVKANVLTTELVNAVRDAVLFQTTWMDHATQEAAMDKLNHTLQSVGFPEEFLDNWKLIDDLYAKVKLEISFHDTLRTIDQSNSWITLQKLSRINARNDPFDSADMTVVYANMYPNSNYIVISAATLQPPMFYAINMDIFNYARLGFVIAHELTHALDIGDMEWGKDGKPFNWWTNATLSNYNARKYTLVDFYNNIPTKNDSVDGRHTLIENAADNGGYRAAYLAFSNFKRRTGYRIKLPGLEALDEDQLFWLIGAQTWCTRNPGSIDGVHAPFRFRVMGSYMNSADFNAAYNCPLGSPMNPRIKAW
ncbi:endothelin-converting enzyme 1-like isoform X2 [Paramacrobiotus metropolitanus]|uniref:endothelin-converting enzyme 1-like isoform X2 n=1 Tax=Paramacrobiotus metropolitanus TaxID=2943436 RepID=UPI0024459993|nr:endothelin-converting enzyme 1-like isoform X2 [Paramacrobiotus metropolitanus]